jgi:gamma-glutamylcysteine synthetase
MHGLNPHNVGGYAIPFHSTEEILQYIASMSMYCTMRDGVYLNFPPMPLFDYFSAEEITGEYYDGSCYQKQKFHPELADLEHLRSFKFEDLTFRGTVEFRSVCTQPIGEILSTGAFHVGLMRNLSALTELLEQDKVLYGHGYHAMELRELFSKVQFPKFVEKEDLTSQLLRILQLAEDGLRQRGYGEERFLQPLFFSCRTITKSCKMASSSAKKKKINVGTCRRVWKT